MMKNRWLLVVGFLALPFYGWSAEGEPGHVETGPTAAQELAAHEAAQKAQEAAEQAVQQAALLKQMKQHINDMTKGSKGTTSGSLSVVTSGDSGAPSSSATPVVSRSTSVTPSESEASVIAQAAKGDATSLPGSSTATSSLPSSGSGHSDSGSKANVSPDISPDYGNLIDYTDTVQLDNATPATTKGYWDTFVKWVSDIFSSTPSSTPIDLAGLKAAAEAKYQHYTVYELKDELVVKQNELASIRQNETATDVTSRHKILEAESTLEAEIDALTSLIKQAATAKINDLFTPDINLGLTDAQVSQFITDAQQTISGAAVNVFQTEINNVSRSLQQASVSQTTRSTIVIAYQNAVQDLLSGVLAQDDEFLTTNALEANLPSVQVFKTIHDRVNVVAQEAQAVITKLSTGTTADSILTQAQAILDTPSSTQQQIDTATLDQAIVTYLQAHQSTMQTILDPVGQYVNAQVARMEKPWNSLSVEALQSLLGTLQGTLVAGDTSIIGRIGAERVQLLEKIIAQKTAAAPAPTK